MVYTYNVFPKNTSFIKDYFTSSLVHLSFINYTHKNSIFCFIIKADSTKIITWEMLETSALFFNRNPLVLCNLFEF